MGTFVRVATDQGLEVVGTEIAPMGVKMARERFGVELHLGQVEDVSTSQPFDAAVMWEVIEHCPRPDEVLGAAVARLCDGGRVLLTTGNYESLTRVAEGKNWWCWKSDHYHYFSPRGIARLGKSVGPREFKMERVARLKVNSGSNTRPSPYRFLNPWHVGRSLRFRVARQIVRRRRPDHWDIGVILCSMTKLAAVSDAGSDRGGGDP